MTNDFFRWSPRTPTTGYFLATLQVATTNGSMNVLAASPPEITELKRRPSSVLPDRNAGQKD